MKRAASTKRAAVNNKSSAQKFTKRAATSSRKRVLPRTSVNTTTTTANQAKEAEAEAQRLKAEATAEKQKLAQERQLFEAEKQKLEEEKRKLEAEKQELDAEKKAEAERLQAEEEAKRLEAEAVAKKEAEAKAEEEKRLLALRIKKVEGTDDYTCIDGWTNQWSFTQGQLSSAKIMDSNGVIKNTDDRNTYGKNKVGCPIKATEILTLNSIETYNSNINYKEEEKIVLISSSIGNITSKPVFQLFSYKMDEKDITNDPRTGWTEEEKAKWEGYKPVIGTTYILSNNVTYDSAEYKGNNLKILSLAAKLIPMYRPKFRHFN